MNRPRHVPAESSTNATGMPIPTERPGADVANMRREAYRQHDPRPGCRVSSGGDFHAGAEQSQLDVVHHRDPERLTCGGIKLRCDRLVARPADPRRLVPAHGLAADPDDDG